LRAHDCLSARLDDEESIGRAHDDAALEVRG
jgi:hypothetical protein